MERQEFETTEGLLKDVMRKQAGSVEKAVLEAVMNAIDANATEIRVDLKEDKLTIVDNGKGMEKSEVDKYFKKFGLKDDDIQEKEFGKFRMGRGQIFNFGVNVWHTQDNMMIVNLEDAHTTVEVGGEEQELDTSGLSYVWLESEEDVDGCAIKVDLFNEIDDVGDTVRNIENQIRYMSWLHDVEIVVNDKICDDEFDYDYETDQAYFNFIRGTYSSRTTVYNKGAYVKNESISPVESTIVTREDLDLNFARNDILTGCRVWDVIRQQYNEHLRSFLIKQDELDTKETEWLIEQANEEPSFWEEIYDKEIIPDISGVMHSIKSLEGEAITFADPKDNVAQELSKRSSKNVIPKKLKDPFTGDDSPFEVVNYEDAVESDFKFELSEYSENNLSKRRKENLLKLRWAMREVSFYGEVKSGSSKHRDTWMLDDSTLLVDKDFLNAKKDKLVTDVLLTCIKEAAHKQDTRTNPSEDFGYNRRFKNMIDSMPPVQRKLFNNSKDVKEYVKRHK